MTFTVGSRLVQVNGSTVVIVQPFASVHYNHSTESWSGSVDKNGMSKNGISNESRSKPGDPQKTVSLCNAVRNAVLMYRPRPLRGPEGGGGGSRPPKIRRKL